MADSSTDRRPRAAAGVPPAVEKREGPKMKKALIGSVVLAAGFLAAGILAGWGFFIPGVLLLGAGLFAALFSRKVKQNAAQETRAVQEIISRQSAPALSRAGSSRFTVLIENHKQRGREELKTDHGIALYLERDGRHFLLDTGSGEATYKNAAALGKEMAAVEAVFISHSHDDHGGGLSRFLELNKKAEVFMSKEVAARRYYGKMGFIKKEISIDRTLFKRHAERFNFVDKLTQIGPGLFVLPTIEHRFPLPSENARLYKESGRGLVRDDFDHEQVLVIKDPDGLVVFSGCCHSGVLNVIHAVEEQFPENPIKAVIGGFHLANLLLAKLGQKELDVIALGEALRQSPVQLFLTGHCTGVAGFQNLKKTLGDRLAYFYTGMEFSL
jgi:7,8-dihydropterin-6-yl-methyl-4-(beta-D-ribofuranosyl)aminobenzene 5'-phosphate synthase